MSARLKKNLIYILVLLCMAITAYFILPVSIPLLLAFFTAMLLNRPVLLLEEKLRVSRFHAVLAVFLSFMVLMGLFGYFVTTRVFTEAVKIVENTPQYLNVISDEWAKVQTSYANASKNLPEEIVTEISEQIENFLNNLRVDLLAYLNINNLKALLTNIPSYFISFLVYLIALFLFLLELPILKSKFYGHLTQKTADKVNFMAGRLSYVILGVLKAQLLVSMIIFIVSLIGLLFISPDVAIIVSLIIWAIDFIPIIGSIVILGPWSLYEFLIGNASMGSQLTVLAAILLIIRRTVEPKVMGAQMGLSPLAVLIAMYMGVKILGIWGFILGPLLLIIFTSAREAGIIALNFKI